ncbi:hypothetical protein AVEN_161706-1, partial [Araneus ventricosus]
MGFFQKQCGCNSLMKEKEWNR